MDRYYLSQGLKKLEEQKDLTPRQRFSRSLTLPGLTEQGRHGLGELAKQEAQGNALNKYASTLPPEEKIQRFPESNQQTNQPGATRENSPSVTTRAPLEATLKPRLPATQDEILRDAAQRFNANPALYEHDPKNAVAAAEQADLREQNRNIGLQQQRQNELAVQDRVVNDFKNQISELNAKAPGNVSQKVLDKAFNSVKSVEDGGEGLTEQEATRQAGLELEAASREYSAIKSLGNWTFIARSPSENKRAIKENREGFKARDDLENFADTLVGSNGLSNPVAYAEAYPVQENKPLYNELKSAATQKVPVSARGMGTGGSIANQKDIDKKTLELSKKLLENLAEGSPLAVAQYLKGKNYNPEVWLNYIGNNRDKLNKRQERELGKARNFTPTLNDMWMRFSTNESTGE